MDVVITPNELTGSIDAIASKSMAHRLLICAALSSAPTTITCTTTSKDIEATIECLRALGATIERIGDKLHVEPLFDQEGNTKVAQGALLDCGESGSTLRFMLPVVAALGFDAALTGHGRLSQRPLSPLYEELIVGGCNLSEQGTFPLFVKGKLRAGRFELPGNVSSQYISGLMLAAPLMQGTTEIRVSNPIESKPYLDLTISALKSFGVEVASVQQVDATDPSKTYTCFSITDGSRYTSCGAIDVEGDWSNAAFWLAIGALGSGMTVTNIDLMSRQGDKAILAALAKLGARVSRQGKSASVCLSTPQATIIDASNFPDLVPPLAAVAALTPGHTSITNCARLRLKESDRIETVCTGLAALGAAITSTEDTIEIDGKEMLEGGTINAANDHRIAMMGAVAAMRCASEVTIEGAECTEKSYPAFFDDYARLGGIVKVIR